jgi:hypothetical protein
MEKAPFPVALTRRAGRAEVPLNREVIQDAAIDVEILSPCSVASRMPSLRSAAAPS